MSEALTFNFHSVICVYVCVCVYVCMCVYVCVCVLVVGIYFKVSEGQV